MEIDGESFPSFTYDVFLSFRGEDTRRTFTGNLHEAMRKRGINTFFDDEKLKRGEDIPPALFKAIEESRILVVVFSENYASSTWCLRELAKIHECMKKEKKTQLVFPIFYDVDPSDVRHQKKLYREAMFVHENKFGKDSEEVQNWRLALSEVANKKGDHFRLRGLDYEFKFIQEFVQEVSNNLPPKPSLYISEHPVGLESRVQEVKSLLDIKHNDNSVCMLGICGVGGIGKTALAKALYNKIAHQFQAASFLSDVREKSEKGNGLENLQKILLSEMRENPETDIGSTSKGMSEIESKLRHKKVLLVLDDIDKKEKLEQLAGGCDWFGPGSRIIITTRNKDVLIAHGVKIYDMTKFDYKESLELLCWNAFKKSHPEAGYEGVASQAVSYAKGLPLALKIIGSNLHKKSLKAWESALKQYQRILDKGIHDVLKISYDCLNDYTKYVFLDIACFFKGEGVDYVIEILDACGFEATLNIEVLVDKSLVTIEHGCLKMHDLLQEMGREIVREEAPSSPGKRSRLWYYEDVLEVLTEKSKGSSKIEGIILDPPQLQKLQWSGAAFKKMSKLRILIIRNTHFLSEPKTLPNNLRLLDWEEYPSNSFPTDFYPEKIVVFNLCKSHLTLEEPFQEFSRLTCMNFSYSESLTEVPDVSNVPNLRELRLDYCKNLIKVHESVGLLEKLVHLSASECTKLKSFLPSMFLPSLETLDLNFCVRLEHFPEIEGEMNTPLKIYMIHTAIQELPDSIDNLIGLECIEMPSSKRLRDVPSSLFILPKFATFKIGGCSQLRESFRRFLLEVEGHSAANGGPKLRTLDFRNGGLTNEDLHAVLKCFPNIEELNASENNFVYVPACIKECDKLTTLDVSVCRELQEIPECTNLRILDVNRCVKLEDISELPSTIQKVDARYCLSLNSKTSTMLWSQVRKGIDKLEIVMPKTEIPEWLFDYCGKGGTPCFWARGKFPNFALALALEDVNGMAERSRPSRRQLVDLHLFINGQCVPRKGYYNFSIAEDHVLLCDLRAMFSDKEWQDLDHAFLQNDWNLVQVKYEAPSSLTLTSWGVYAYKQHSRKEDVVEFTCPDPKYSDTAITTSTSVPTTSDKQRQLRMIENMCLADMFDGMLMESMNLEEQNNFVDKDFAINEHHNLMGSLKKISKQAKSFIESNRPSGSGSGKDRGSQLEDKDSKLLGWLLRTVEEMDKKDESVFIHEGIALVKVKKVDQDLKAPMALEAYEIASTSTPRHDDGSSSSDKVQGLEPQPQQLLMDIFLDGMNQGLREAKLSFPTLDIDTTMKAALSKANQVSWERSVSEVENNDDAPSVEMITYMEGVMNGLLEARLSFPTLDIPTTMNAAFKRAYEGNSLLTKAPAFHWYIRENGSTSGNRPGSSASESVIQHDDHHPPPGELPRVRQQILGSNTLSLKLVHGEWKGKAPFVIEASSSPLEGSSETQEVQVQGLEPRQWLMVLDGMIHGLGEAKLSFPTLDIDTTINAILTNKGIQVTWPPSEEEDKGYAVPPMELNLYLQGMINGLVEAQLSFPTLDISNTIISASSRASEGRTTENEEHVEETTPISDTPKSNSPPTVPQVDNPPDTSPPCLVILPIIKNMLRCWFFKLMQYCS